MALGADADDTFFYEFGAATLELRQAFARQVGFSWSRVRVLLWLRREGETRHSELRQRLGADGATVTRLVKQFESEGLLSRRPDPTDNRYTLAALTEAGEAAAEEVERSHRRFQQQLLAGVAERDRQAVLRVLRRFRVNAEATSSGPAQRDMRAAGVERGRLRAGYDRSQSRESLGALADAVSRH